MEVPGPVQNDHGINLGRCAARCFNLEVEYGDEDDFLKVLPIPSSFTCPLSLGMMEDPVATVDGLAYERTQIEQWFFRCNQTNSPITSPATGTTLPSAKLISLNALRSAIETYMKLRPELKNWHLAGMSFEGACRALQEDLATKQALYAGAEDEISRLRQTCENDLEEKEALRRSLEDEFEHRLKAVRSGVIEKAKAQALTKLQEVKAQAACEREELSEKMQKNIDQLTRKLQLVEGEQQVCQAKLEEALEQVETYRYTCASCQAELSEARQQLDQHRSDLATAAGLVSQKEELCEKLRWQMNTLRSDHRTEIKSLSEMSRNQADVHRLKQKALLAGLPLGWNCSWCGEQSTYVYSYAGRLQSFPDNEDSFWQAPHSTSKMPTRPKLFGDNFFVSLMFLLRQASDAGALADLAALEIVMSICTVCTGAATQLLDAGVVPYLKSITRAKGYMSTFKQKVTKLWMLLIQRASFQDVPLADIIHFFMNSMVRSDWQAKFDLFCILGHLVHDSEAHAKIIDEQLAMREEQDWFWLFEGLSSFQASRLALAMSFMLHEISFWRPESRSVVVNCRLRLFEMIIGEFKNFHGEVTWINVGDSLLRASQCFHAGYRTPWPSMVHWVRGRGFKMGMHVLLEGRAGVHMRCASRYLRMIILGCLDTPIFGGFEKSSSLLSACDALALAETHEFVDAMAYLMHIHRDSAEVMARHSHIMMSILLPLLTIIVGRQHCNPRILSDHACIWGEIAVRQVVAYTTRQMDLITNKTILQQGRDRCGRTLV